ncbi:MAG TPA: PilZ domain-containing protein, partial [Burkholderiales bacterium]|nr:PilZ domain-containing protein [Burkholderiales bacterium]
MPNIIQKRQFNRLNVIQPAMLVSRVFGAIKGEIRDFSANGILFALSNSPMAVNLPDQPVAVSFKSASGQYRITGRIVRVFERSIGIAIDNFTDSAYQALVSLAQPSFNPVTPDPAPYGKINTTPADTGCMTLYCEFIDRVLGDFYGNLESRLVALELKETSTSQRWALRHAAPMLLARRKEIEVALLADPVAWQKKQ